MLNATLIDSSLDSFDFILVFPYTMCTLDIETLALHSQKAAIDEISYVATNFLVLGRTKDRSATEVSVEELEARLNEYLKRRGVETEPYRLVYNAEGFFLNWEMQVAEGRVVESDTLKFRINNLRKKNKGSFLSRNQGLHWTDYQEQAEAVETALKGLFDPNKVGCKELWVNHPEFDLPKLRNFICRGDPSREAPWPYRSVRDIGGFRDRMQQVLSNSTHSTSMGPEKFTLCNFLLEDIRKTPAAHEATEDCIYNLRMLALLHVFYGELCLGVRFVRVPRTIWNTEWDIEKALEIR